MPTSLPSIRLSPDIITALEEAAAKPLSYQLRYLATPAGDRLLVVLGEAHMKLGAAHRLGERIVDGFRLRGVETFPRTALLGRLLRGLIHGPRLLLRVATLGIVKGSTITTARELEDGVTVTLESERNVPLSLHVASVYLSGLFSVVFGSLICSLAGAPSRGLGLAAVAIELHLLLTILPAYFLRDHWWHWCVSPAVAILTTRNVTMADGTIRMLRDHAEPREAVVVMGRAHVAGYCRELIERHGCVELDPRLLRRMARTV